MPKLMIEEKYKVWFNFNFNFNSRKVDNNIDHRRVSHFKYGSSLGIMYTRRLEVFESVGLEQTNL
jgi:uncharacterized protein YijF (DUF1287 family)